MVNTVPAKTYYAAVVLLVALFTILWSFSRPALHLPWRKIVVRPKFGKAVTILDKKIISSLENAVDKQGVGWHSGNFYFEAPAGEVAVECCSGDGTRHYLDVSSSGSRTWISWQSAEDWIDGRKPTIKYVSSDEHQLLMELISKK